MAPIQKGLKVVAFLLLLTFLSEQFLYAYPEPEKLRLSPGQREDFLPWAKSTLPKFPDSVAVIEDAFQVSNAKERYPLVILVQDAHTNDSGQINLAKTLDLLFSSTLHPSPFVFTEAASKNASLSYLRKRAPLESRKRTALNFLKKGLLHGVEYLDLTSDHSFQIWGVENPEDYKKSLEIYTKVFQEREKFQNYLDQIDQTIQTLRPQILNPALMRFTEKHESYEDGKTPLTDFFEILNYQSEMLQIDLSRYPHLEVLKKLKDKEKKIDFKKANTEQVEAVQSLSQRDQEELKVLADSAKREVFKIGQREEKEGKVFYDFLKERLNLENYPELRKYLDYLELAKKLEAKELLGELDSLTEMIFVGLISTPDESKLIACAKTTKLLHRLLNLTLTAGEYGEYKKISREWTIENLSGFLNEKIMDLHKYEERAVFLEGGYDEVVKRAEEFYTLTFKRDKNFIQEMLDKLTEEKNLDRPAILVTGGFHTSNLKNILKEKNISYISITPQVFNETNQKRYESLLLNQKMPASASRLAVPGNLMTVLARNSGSFPLLYDGDDIFDAARIEEALTADFETYSMSAHRAGTRLANFEKITKLHADQFYPDDFRQNTYARAVYAQFGKQQIAQFGHALLTFVSDSQDPKVHRKNFEEAALDFITADEGRSLLRSLALLKGREVSAEEINAIHAYIKFPVSAEDAMKSSQSGNFIIQIEVRFKTLFGFLGIRSKEDTSILLYTNLSTKRAVAVTHEELSGEAAWDTRARVNGSMQAFVSDPFKLSDGAIVRYGTLAQDPEIFERILIKGYSRALYRNAIGKGKYTHRALTNLINRLVWKPWEKTFAEGDLGVDLAVGEGRDLWAYDASQNELVPLSASLTKKIIATDFMSGPLDAIRERYPNMRTERADWTQLPLADQSVRAVFGLNALSYVPEADLDSVVAELDRILKPRDPKYPKQIIFITDISPSKGLNPILAGLDKDYTGYQSDAEQNEFLQKWKKAVTQAFARKGYAVKFEVVTETFTGPALDFHENANVYHTGLDGIRGARDYDLPEGTVREEVQALVIHIEKNGARLSEDNLEENVKFLNKDLMEAMEKRFGSKKTDFSTVPFWIALDANGKFQKISIEQPRRKEPGAIWLRFILYGYHKAGGVQVYSRMKWNKSDIKRLKAFFPQMPTENIERMIEIVCSRFNNQDLLMSLHVPKAGYIEESEFELKIFSKNRLIIQKTLLQSKSIPREMYPWVERPYEIEYDLEEPNRFIWIDRKNEWIRTIELDDAHKVRTYSHLIDEAIEVLNYSFAYLREFSLDSDSLDFVETFLARLEFARTESQEDWDDDSISGARLALEDEEVQWVRDLLPMSQHLDQKHIPRLRGIFKKILPELQIDEAKKLYSENTMTEKEFANEVLKLASKIEDSERETLLRVLILLSKTYNASAHLQAIRLYQLQDYAEGLFFLEAALALDPKNESLLSDRGIAYFHAGRHEEAHRIYAKRLEANRFSRNDTTSYAYLRLADVAAIVRAFKEALRSGNFANAAGFMKQAEYEIKEAESLFYRALNSYRSHQDDSTQGVPRAMSGFASLIMLSADMYFQAARNEKFVRLKDYVSLSVIRSIQAFQYAEEALEIDLSNEHSIGIYNDSIDNLDRSIALYEKQNPFELMDYKNFEYWAQAFSSLRQTLLRLNAGKIRLASQNSKAQASLARIEKFRLAQSAVIERIRKLEKRFKELFIDIATNEPLLSGEDFKNRLVSVLSEGIENGNLPEVSPAEKEMLKRYILFLMHSIKFKAQDLVVIQAYALADEKSFEIVRQYAALTDERLTVSDVKASFQSKLFRFLGIPVLTPYVDETADARESVVSTPRLDENYSWDTLKSHALQDRKRLESVQALDRLSGWISEENYEKFLAIRTDIEKQMAFFEEKALDLLQNRKSMKEVKGDFSQLYRMRNANAKGIQNMGYIAKLTYLKKKIDALLNQAELQIVQEANFIRSERSAAELRWDKYGFAWFDLINQRFEEVEEEMRGLAGPISEENYLSRQRFDELIAETEELAGNLDSIFQDKETFTLIEEVWTVLQEIEISVKSLEAIAPNEIVKEKKNQLHVLREDFRNASFDQEGEKKLKEILIRSQEALFEIKKLEDYLKAREVLRARYDLAAKRFENVKGLHSILIDKGKAKEAKSYQGLIEVGMRELAKKDILSDRIPGSREEAQKWLEDFEKDLKRYEDHLAHLEEEKAAFLIPELGRLEDFWAHISEWFMEKFDQKFYWGDRDARQHLMEAMADFLILMRSFQKDWMKFIKNKEERELYRAKLAKIQADLRSGFEKLGQTEKDSLMALSTAQIRKYIADHPEKYSNVSTMKVSPSLTNVNNYLVGWNYRLLSRSDEEIDEITEENDLFSFAYQNFGSQSVTMIDKNKIFDKWMRFFGLKIEAPYLQLADLFALIIHFYLDSFESPIPTPVKGALQPKNSYDLSQLIGFNREKHLLSPEAKYTLLDQQVLPVEISTNTRIGVIAIHSYDFRRRQEDHDGSRLANFNMNDLEEIREAYEEAKEAVKYDHPGRRPRLPEISEFSENLRTLTILSREQINTLINFYNAARPSRPLRFYSKEDKNELRFGDIPTFKKILQFVSERDGLASWEEIASFFKVHPSSIRELIRKGTSELEISEAQKKIVRLYRKRRQIVPYIYYQEKVDRLRRILRIFDDQKGFATIQDLVRGTGLKGAVTAEQVFGEKIDYEQFLADMRSNRRIINDLLGDRMAYLPVLVSGRMTYLNETLTALETLEGRPTAQELVPLLGGVDPSLVSHRLRAIHKNIGFEVINYNRSIDNLPPLSGVLLTKRTKAAQDRVIEALEKLQGVGSNLDISKAMGRDYDVVYHIVSKMDFETINVYRLQKGRFPLKPIPIETGITKDRPSASLLKNFDLVLNGNSVHRVMVEASRRFIQKYRFTGYYGYRFSTLPLIYKLIVGDATASDITTGELQQISSLLQEILYAIIEYGPARENRTKVRDYFKVVIPRVVNMTVDPRHPVLTATNKERFLENLKKESSLYSSIGARLSKEETPSIFELPEPIRTNEELIAEIRRKFESQPFSDILADWVESHMLEVYQERVFEAIRKSPRELFVLPSEAKNAYEDHPSPIGFGQTISQPSLMALILTVVHPTQFDKVLEVGAGSGWFASLLGHLGSEVYTTEILKIHAETAQANIEKIGLKNVHVIHTPDSIGYAQKAPYRLIIVSAGTMREAVPEALVDQLEDGGLLVIPVYNQKESAAQNQLIQTIRVYSKASGQLYEIKDITDSRYVPLVQRSDFGEGLKEGSRLADSKSEALTEASKQEFVEFINNGNYRSLRLKPFSAESFLVRVPNGGKINFGRVKHPKTGKPKFLILNVPEFAGQEVLVKKSYNWTFKNWQIVLVSKNSPEKYYVYSIRKEIRSFLEMKHYTNRILYEIRNAFLERNILNQPASFQHSIHYSDEQVNELLKLIEEKDNRTKLAVLNALRRDVEPIVKNMINEILRKYSISNENVHIYSELIESLGQIYAFALENALDSYLQSRDEGEGRKGLRVHFRFHDDGQNIYLSLAANGVSVERAENSDDKAGKGSKRFGGFGVGLPTIDMFSTFTYYDGTFTILDRRKTVGDKNGSVFVFGFPKHKVREWLKPTTRSRSQEIDRKVSFLSDVFRVKKKIGRIAVGDSLFELVLNKDESVSIYLKGQDEAVFVLDQSNARVLTQGNDSQIEITIKQSDFKKILDEAYKKVDSVSVEALDNSKKVVSVLNLDAIGFHLKSFESVILPFLAEELKLAQRSKWGQSARFLLYGSDEDKERLLALLATNYPELTGYVVKNEADLADYKEAQKIAVTPSKLSQAETRYFFTKALEEGDLPNFRATFKLAVTLARVDRLETSDKTLQEIFAALSFFLKSEINPSELIPLINGTNFNALAKYALPPIIHLQINELVRGVRLATKMTAQSA